MMIAPGLPITPADSALAAAQVYSVSLLACVPLVVALIGALAWRQAPAGMRSLMWKSAITGMLIVYVGRALPFSWFSWSVPNGFAEPLIVLGRLQLTTIESLSLGRAADAGASVFVVGALVQALWIIYLVGVIACLVSLGRTVIGKYLLAQHSRPLCDDHWLALVSECRRALGLTGTVTLLVTRDRVVPQTWGIVRPVVLLPESALGWNESARRATLLHELAHIQRWDVLFLIVSRLACALYWFHPGSWWASRRLAAECEMACDDRVLAAGVAPSDYAELLLMASTRNEAELQPAVVALGGRGGSLRERLRAIVGPPRQFSATSWRTAASATCLTLLISFPTSTVHLAPTRAALTTLLRDDRWESRAYAAAGLAQRRDSVDVARAAAQLDPSPRVRALARYALTQPRGRDLPAILANQR